VMTDECGGGRSGGGEVDVGGKNHQATPAAQPATAADWFQSTTRRNWLYWTSGRLPEGKKEDKDWMMMMMESPSDRSSFGKKMTEREKNGGAGELVRECNGGLSALAI
jgi:hypothetical protein